MTTAGDAAPDRSPSDWIVRLHTHRGGDPDATPPGSDPTVVLAGDVVAHRGHAGTNFGSVSVHRRAAAQPLVLTSDTVDLRCESRDLPDDSRNTEPATDLDHVVHVICSRFDEPEAIEEFLEATRGLNGYIIGREAWLEVIAHPTDPDGGTSDHPLIDDVYFGRYRSAEEWLELHEWDPWKHAIEKLEAEGNDDVPPRHRPDDQSADHIPLSDGRLPGAAATTTAAATDATATATLPPLLDGAVNVCAVAVEIRGAIDTKSEVGAGHHRPVGCSGGLDGLPPVIELAQGNSPGGVLPQQAHLGGRGRVASLGVLDEAAEGLDLQPSRRPLGRANG